jgi:protein involved in polysaccharide export with SLBB domain
MRPSPRRSWLLIPLLLAGCAPRAARPAPVAAQPDRPFPTLATAPREQSSYLLQRGDRIAIKFYGNPELNEALVIRPDGMVSLPLIDDIQAAGRTPAELDADLTERYASELARPNLTVIVRRPSGELVYIGGEVGEQGVVRLRAGMSLFQAIQAAGGFTKTAHRKQVILIRRDAAGQAVGRSIDVRPVQTGERPSEDVPLRPYDVVFVPRSKVANVNVFVEQYIRNNLPIQTIPFAF